MLILSNKNLNNLEGLRYINKLNNNFKIKIINVCFLQAFIIFKKSLFFSKLVHNIFKEEINIDYIKINTEVQFKLKKITPKNITEVTTINIFIYFKFILKR